MFTLHFAERSCLGIEQIRARAQSFRQLVAFADKLAPNKCGVIASHWIERDGNLEMDLFDWCDCCCAPPTPVFARVVAPPGFRPPSIRTLDT